jgi:activator of HSP90 ATPase
LDKIKVSVKLNCSAKEVFIGWLKSETHAMYTGGEPAVASQVEGGSFTAWNGYISGHNIELFPYKKIVQAWRTTEFTDQDPDSLLEITFSQKADHTLLSISHSNLPEGSGETYKKGWKSFYFSHMKNYFEPK